MRGKREQTRKWRRVWQKQIAHCEIDANNMQMMQKMKCAGEAKTPVTKWKVLCLFSGV